MQTKEQVENAFREDMRALLHKYDAAIEAVFVSELYCEMSIRVYIPERRDKDENLIREFAEIDYGCYTD